MIKNSILIFVSIILEIVVSILVKSNGYFLPLFVFLATIYLSFTIKDTKKSLLFCFMVGMIYDMTITNTWFLNATLFTLISWIGRNIEKLIYGNQVTLLFSFIGYIVLYRTMTYIILTLIGYKTFMSLLLFKSILASIFLNFLYVIFLRQMVKPYKKI